MSGIETPPDAARPSVTPPAAERQALEGAVHAVESAFTTMSGRARLRFTPDAAEAPEADALEMVA